MRNAIIVILVFIAANIGYSKTFNFSVGLNLNPTLKKQYQVFTDPNNWPFDQQNATVIPQKKSKSGDYNDIYSYGAEVLLNLSEKIPLYFGLSFNYSNKNIQKKNSPGQFQENFSLMEFGIPILYQFDINNKIYLNSGIVLGLDLCEANIEQYRLSKYVAEPGAEEEHLWELIDEYDYSDQKLLVLPRMDIVYKFMNHTYASIILQYKYASFKDRKFDLDRAYNLKGLMIGIKLGLVI